MLRRISDPISFSEGRTHTRPTPEAIATVLPSIPESPRTLTFAELQSLVEQGKTDEIPNNKDIPEAINVVPISYSVLSCLAHEFTTGGCTQPVERTAAQKALGIPVAIGMTSEAELSI